MLMALQVILLFYSPFPFSPYFFFLLLYFQLITRSLPHFLTSSLPHPLISLTSLTSLTSLSSLSPSPPLLLVLFDYGKCAKEVDGLKTLRSTLITSWDLESLKIASGNDESSRRINFQFFIYCISILFLFCFVLFYLFYFIVLNYNFDDVQKQNVCLKWNLISMG